MHTFSTPPSLSPPAPKISENLTVFWCFQRLLKECIRNIWVNLVRLSEKSLDSFISKQSHDLWLNSCAAEFKTAL